MPIANTLAAVLRGQGFPHPANHGHLACQPSKTEQSDTMLDQKQPVTETDIKVAMGSLINQWHGGQMTSEELAAAEEEIRQAGIVTVKFQLKVMEQVKIEL